MNHKTAPVEHDVSASEDGEPLDVKLHSEPSARYRNVYLSKRLCAGGCGRLVVKMQGVYCAECFYGNENEHNINTPTTPLRKAWRAAKKPRVVVEQHELESCRAARAQSGQT